MRAEGYRVHGKKRFLSDADAAVQNQWEGRGELKKR